jgi:hypothetical protein
MQTALSPFHLLTPLTPPFHPAHSAGRAQLPSWANYAIVGVLVASWVLLAAEQRWACLQSSCCCRPSRQRRSSLSKDISHIDRLPSAADGQAAGRREGQQQQQQGRPWCASLSWPCRARGAPPSTLLQGHSTDTATLDAMERCSSARVPDGAPPPARGGCCRPCKRQRGAVDEREEWERGARQPSPLPRDQSGVSRRGSSSRALRSELSTEITTMPQPENAAENPVGRSSPKPMDLVAVVAGRAVTQGGSINSGGPRGVPPSTATQSPPPPAPGSRCRKLFELVLLVYSVVFPTVLTTLMYLQDEQHYWRLGIHVGSIAVALALNMYSVGPFPGLCQCAGAAFASSRRGRAPLSGCSVDRRQSIHVHKQRPPMGFRGPLFALLCCHSISE